MNKPQEQHISDHSIDKIRDILFGREIAEIKHHFAQMQVTMKEQNAALEKMIQQVEQHSDDHFTKLATDLENLNKLHKSDLATTEQQLTQAIEKLSKDSKKSYQDLKGIVDDKSTQLGKDKVERDDLAQLLLNVAKTIAGSKDPKKK